MRSLTPKDIGALVRDARLEAGLTQTALAEKIGASRFWVVDFERGKARAELGLALKALRALRLVVSIIPKELALQREQEAKTAELGRAPEPTINLAALLDRLLTTSPQRRRAIVDTPNWETLKAHGDKGDDSQSTRPRANRSKRKS